MGEPFYSEDAEEPLRGDPREHKRFWLGIWVILGIVLILYLVIGVIINNQKENSLKSNKIMSEDKRFACAINCMDGRVQKPVYHYMKEHYGVDYVDMGTEPGPDKILAENSDKSIIDNIRKRVAISVEHHGSRVIAIIGHFGCAGNPVDKEKHFSDLKEAKKTVESFGFNVEIILLWVGDGWQEAELIPDKDFSR